MTLVLIGFQGSGKSATGNTILRRNCFISDMGTIGTTKQVQVEEMSYGNTTVTIVDTPPLLSTKTLTTIKKELSNQQKTTAVYAIVIAVGRFTEAEKIIVNEILLDGQNVMQGRTLLIFTRKNELQGYKYAENKLGEWLKNTPTIQGWIDKYKLCYFAVENSSQEYDCETDKILETALHFTSPEKDQNCLEKLRLCCCYLCCCWWIIDICPDCVKDNAEY